MSASAIEENEGELIAGAKAEAAEDDDEIVGIWSWGAGTDGQLGTGTLEDKYSPQPLHLQFPPSSSCSISRLACGGAHSIALTGDGRVLTWGRGTKGQLGHGEVVNCLKPKVVKFFENFIISYVSAGWSHSGFVTDSGCLFMCGDGSFGQLGTGDYRSHSFPIEISYFVTQNVRQVACGLRHSLVIARGSQEDMIYGFGSARHGQIGVPLSGPDRLRSCNLPIVINGLENHEIACIYANGDQSASLTADEQLYTWGKGFGQSSADHSPRVFPSSLRFSQIALGWNHALVIADGEVYILGGKHHGLLSSTQQTKTEKRASNSSAQCTSSDSLAPSMEKVSCIGDENVVDVAAGAEHSALVTGVGKVMTWGWGEHGQLGLGDTNDHTSPQTVDVGYKGLRNGANVRVCCGSGFTLVVKSV